MTTADTAASKHGRAASKHGRANLLHGTACSAHSPAVTPAGPTVAEISLILPHTKDPNPQSMHALDTNQSIPCS